MRCVRCRTKLYSSDNYCQVCGTEVKEDIKKEVIKEENRSKAFVKILFGISIILFGISAFFFVDHNFIDHGANRRNCGSAICPKDCKEGICVCKYLDSDGEEKEIECEIHRNMYEEDEE